MYEDYKSISTSIRGILGKTVKEISNESTDEYRKSLEKIAKDRQLKSLSKKDKDTLIKIANLMKRANEALDQGDEEKVKEIIGLLRKASDSHAKQADDLQKAVDEDELEEANTDKYMWKDINRALMNAGLNPRQIMKVAGLLKGKELKEESGVDEDAETTAADASSKDMSLGKMIRRKDDEDEVNEVKTSIFTLNDMDDEDAATVIAMAKRAGVFLRTKKVSMKRSDVQLKGDKKKIFKFINSLPESIQYKKN